MTATRHLIASRLQAVGETRHYALVLQRDLESNIALGYVEVARNWQLSCQEWQALLEWSGAGDPPPIERAL